MEKDIKFFIGVVAEDKEDKSDIIYVFLQDKFPTANMVANELVEVKAKIKGFNGENIVSKAEKGYYIKAIWTRFGTTNQVTSPDVRKGETVLLMQYKDVDQYFWAPFYKEIDLRGHEKVIHMYGNVKAGTAKLTDKNTYYSVYDTKDKRVVLIKTNKNDGEACTYEISMNTAVGGLFIKDDLGNEITFNSKKGEVAVIAKQKIFLQSPDIMLDCERFLCNASAQATFKTPKMLVTGIIESLRDVVVSVISLLRHKHIANGPTSPPIP